VTLSLSSLFVTAILVLVYLLHGAIVVRKVAFFVSLFTLVLFIVATALSITQLRAANNVRRAVILANDTIPVHASPDSGSKIIRQPSQGVTVELEREQGEWTEVRFADGEKGWLRTRSVEVI
jgi:SH3-like domain-containing protein